MSRDFAIITHDHSELTVRRRERDKKEESRTASGLAQMWFPRSRRSATTTAMLCCYIFVLSLVFLLQPVNCSSSSNQNYPTYQYDMTVPQFTPDGRLLQVEYASSAADHSKPILVAPVTPHLCLVVCAAATTTTNNRKSPHTGSSSVIRQERLILLPPKETVTTTTMTSDDDDDNIMTVVALSGVLADCHSLLQAAHEESFAQQQWYGGRPGQQRHLAHSVASACQEHAFGGGLRPYGATMLVVSCGTSDTAAADMVLYQTDPSGGLREYGYKSFFDGDVWNGGCIVVGGGPGMARTLERRMAAYRDESLAGTAIPQRIRDIMGMVLEEQQRADNRNEVESESVENEDSGLTLEAVLISTEKGALKLTDGQIKTIQKSAQKTE